MGGDLHGDLTYTACCTGDQQVLPGGRVQMPGAEPLLTA
ncbi:hypothetical protein FHX50_001076 [Helcobacillus massiliensis]|uniref:Uncharacterized protein n=1 Tax=Helcobacillus massiliensis TaxID=521392 RepID=A0A839QT58_9MICO|nr:hypothetical protein [Helcobacillus massiliensis]